MCDSWLIDELQAIVEINSNILLFPGWTNATDNADTKETFGFVPHHPQEVQYSWSMSLQNLIVALCT